MRRTRYTPRQSCRRSTSLDEPTATAPRERTASAGARAARSRACLESPPPNILHRRYGASPPTWPCSPFSGQVWVKPSAEQSFLYGNHVLKAGLGRITEDTPQNQGVLILSMADVPLGFGVTAKSTAECRKLDPQAIVALHQADVGEYLRDEGALAG
eukprot:scaffold82_cov105-Isochrysis_galbana.AAC.4